MKTPSAELHQLIHSLDPHERAFLKRKMNRDGASTINQDLYATLIGMPAYVEREIIARSPLITKGNIKHCKQTLLEYIMNTLELYYTDPKDASALRRAIHVIAILKSKHLFPRAKKLCSSSISKAHEQGQFLLHIELLMIQQDLAIASEDLMEYGRLKRANTKLTHDLYKQYVVFRTNKELNQELFNLNLWDGFYPDPSKVNAVGALRRKIAKRKRVLDQVPHHDLFNVQLLIAEYFSLLLMNQYKEAGECSSQLIKRGVSHLLRFMDEGEYLWHLNWGLTISLHTHDRALADQLIRSAQGFFQKLPTKRRNRSVVVNYHRFLNKMIAYHVHTDQFERAKEMIASMGAELTSEVTSPSIRKIFLINACQVHLCLGEAKQALNFYNRIYNDPGVNSVRVDIDPGVNVLGCAIFHELGSTSNLTSLIRHCMRARHYNKQTKAYKKLILLFKKLIAPMDEPKTRSLIIGVTAELQRIRVERDRTSLFFLENFRVMHWLPRIGSGKPVIR